MQDSVTGVIFCRKEPKCCQQSVETGASFPSPVSAAGQGGLLTPHVIFDVGDLSSATFARSCSDFSTYILLRGLVYEQLEALCLASSAIP